MEKVNKFIDDLKKINVFGDLQKANLPTHGGSKYNGVSFSTMNMAVLLSTIWLLSSIGLFGLGIWHCRNRSTSYKLVCDVNDCELFRNQDLPVRFLRKDFTSANAVRIDINGEVTDTSKMKLKQQKSYGHSVELKFQYAGDNPRYKAEKKLLFSPDDMGSGPAKKVSRDITKFIYKPTEPINVKHGNWTTGIGLCGIVFGIISTVLSLLFGQFQDTPKRLKKAS
jgi:hypothetical protein